MNTAYERDGDYIVCSYCNKKYLYIGKWSFPINHHHAVVDALSNNELICNCNNAKKELKYKQTIAEKEKEIAFYQSKINELSDDGIPF